MVVELQVISRQSNLIANSSHRLRWFEMVYWRTKMARDRAVSNLAITVPLSKIELGEVGKSVSMT